MKTQLSPLSIGSISIRQTSHSQFCINDLHKAAGELSKDQPSKFLLLKSTKELIAELTKDENLVALNNQPVTVINGDKPGTYVVKELVYAYAMWISPSFTLKVIRAFDQLVTTPQPTIPAPERKTKKALPGCLTLEMQDNIKAKVKDRVLHLPANKQAGQIIKQWSAIKQKFGCTYKEIPADEYLNVISLIERLPIEGELLDPVKQKQEIATMTEYDYPRARESLANIRKAAESSVDDSMLSAMFAEIEALEKCLVSAWTHFDESLLRLSTVITFQKRWRGAK